MNGRLLAVFLAAAGPAQAALPDFNLPTHILDEANPPLDAVLDRLGDRSDPRAQTQAASELARRAGGLDMGDQHRVVFALRAAAEAPFNEGQVRGKALDALGKAAAAMSDEAARREAVRAMLEHAAAAGPFDQRTETKIYALRGLTQASGRLPQEDEIRQAVIAAALDAMRDAGRPLERTQGAVLLDSVLRAALGSFLRSAALTGRFEAEVVAPLESGGLDRLYDDSPASLEYRYYLMRSLAITGRAIGPDHTLPQRVRGILAAMAGRDPDPRLREMARLYCARYR